MRRVQSPRRSIMPPSSQLDMTRRSEVETNNNEMSLLYDKYLQTLMTEHIMKKKESENRQIILMHLASLEKKGEECEMKLHEYQMIMNELEPLNELQKYLENQIQEVQTFLVASQSKVTETLDKIHLNLKPFDKLPCKNIIIPKTNEELMTMCDLLDECNHLLDLTSSMMGNNSTEIISTNDSLKKFQKLISITEKLLKRLHSHLENVQIDVLKQGSATINTNNM
ncbi:hypothetical protein PV327_003061 [Microctonus hyperodae]|uniref:Uncharacterized protein n=1 Tax=Microctonus hyperodae TaxID=165561 RepID=A0AA39G383_MICHY|nr:hypothetical protein PV327_003061 [Microctonus hyperodae]